MLECHNTLNSLAKESAVSYSGSQKRIRGNETAVDLVRLEVGQTFMDPEPAVTIFYTQAKEYFPQREEKNKIKAWIQASQNHYQQK